MSALNYLALRITWRNVDEIWPILAPMKGHITPYIGPGRSMELGPGAFIPGSEFGLGKPGDWLIRNGDMIYFRSGQDCP